MNLYRLWAAILALFVIIGANVPVLAAESHCITHNIDGSERVVPICSFGALITSGNSTTVKNGSTADSGRDPIEPPVVGPKPPRNNGPGRPTLPPGFNT